MKITLLGTGTPTPSLQRKGSSYMIEIGADTILFDHGPGSSHRLLEVGKKPQNVTHLFLSHLHYDHCIDYATLVLTHWDQGVGLVPDLKVFGPPHTQRMNELLFASDGVFAPDLQARTQNDSSLAVFKARGGTPPRHWPQPQVRELKPGDTVGGDSWTITTAGVVHVQPFMACYAYRLDSKEGSFVYSGDTGPCAAMAKLARQCDVLVHMCHFMSGSLDGTPFGRDMEKRTTGHLELAHLAQEAGVKNLVLSHIAEQMDVPGVRERVISEVASIYSGGIFFAEDRMQIPIEGPRPNRLD